MTTGTVPRGSGTLAAPRWTWGWLLVAAATQLALGVLWLDPTAGPGRGVAWLFLVVGCVSAARALWLATLRVHLTPDAVVVRGLRPRTIAWRDVRGIDRRRSFWHGDVVRVTPASGTPVTAVVRASWLAGTLERDQAVLEQWWQARADPTAADVPAVPR